MAEMKAAVYDRYGPPEVLRQATIARPEPRASELLIRVEAASLNGYDVIVRSGALKMVTGRAFPKRTGLDFVGEVVSPSSGTSGFGKGDRIWGVMPLHRLGSAAEYVCIEPGHLALRPATLSATDAAALPVVGATALIGLRDVCGLQAGDRLLIRGASGGVGSAAVQIGKALGGYVVGLASGANLDLVRDLGADEALDYRKARPADLGAFDVILDTVGSDLPRWRRLLAPRGRMAAIVPDPARPLRSLATIAFSRIYGGRRVRRFSAKPDTVLLAQLADLVSRGVLRPMVDAVYPLSDIALAHAAFEAGGRRGKQIIRLR